jgi:hypothetical protein
VESKQCGDLCCSIPPILPPGTLPELCCPGEGGCGLWLLKNVVCLKTDG